MDCDHRQLDMDLIGMGDSIRELAAGLELELNFGGEWPGR